MKNNEKIKELDEKLGRLDYDKKHSIAMIFVYSFLLAFSIAVFIYGIITRNIYFCIMYSMLILFTSFAVAHFIIELCKIKEQIKIVCKQIARIVDNEAKEILDKVINDFIKNMEEISKNVEAPKKEQKKESIETKKTTKKTTTKNTQGKKVTTKKTTKTNKEK